MLLAPTHTHTHSNIFSINWLPFSLSHPENGTAQYTVTLEQLKTYTWPNPESQSCTYARNDFRHTTVNA